MTFSIMTFSVMTLSIKRDIQDFTQHNAEHCYAHCWLCPEKFMLSVTYKPFMLSDIMMNVVMLNVPYDKNSLDISLPMTLFGSVVDPMTKVCTRVNCHH